MRKKKKQLIFLTAFYIFHENSILTNALWVLINWIHILNGKFMSNSKDQWDLMRLYEEAMSHLMTLRFEVCFKF